MNPESFNEGEIFPSIKSLDVVRKALRTADSANIMLDDALIEKTPFDTLYLDSPTSNKKSELTDSSQ